MPSSSWSLSSMPSLHGEFHTATSTGHETEHHGNSEFPADLHRPRGTEIGKAFHELFVLSAVGRGPARHEWFKGKKRVSKTVSDALD